MSTNISIKATVIIKKGNYWASYVYNTQPRLVALFDAGGMVELPITQGSTVYANYEGAYCVSCTCKPAYPIV